MVYSESPATPARWPPRPGSDPPCQKSRSTSWTWSSSSGCDWKIIYIIFIIYLFILLFGLQLVDYFSFKNVSYWSLTLKVSYCMSDINNISIQHEKGQVHKHLRQSLLHRTNLMWQMWRIRNHHKRCWFLFCLSYCDLRCAFISWCQVVNNIADNSSFPIRSRKCIEKFIEEELIIWFCAGIAGKVICLHFTYQ